MYFVGLYLARLNLFGKSHSSVEEKQIDLFSPLSVY